MHESGIHNSVRKLFINDRGHTVLSNLMIAILKSQTSGPQITVDDISKDINRWSGGEVSIYRMWDAVSAPIWLETKLLFQLNGSKPTFYQSLVQTTCHCIYRILGPSCAPDVATPSGLFLKHGRHRGQKLQLLRLHSLVLVAFHLARSGCKNENRLSLHAGLACLLAMSEAPLARQPFQREHSWTKTAYECSGEALEPIDIGDRAPKKLMSSWTPEGKPGGGKLVSDNSN